MKRVPHAFLGRVHRHAWYSSAFTLIEVVLSLVIIATAFVALLGLLPAGLSASRSAVDSSVAGFILENVHQRLAGEYLDSGTPTFSPAFFDAEGTYIPREAKAPDLARRLYRAEIHIGAGTARPDHTSALRPVRIALFWPVNRLTGEAMGTAGPQLVVTYAATTHTGPDWPQIDAATSSAAAYRPRIEF